jgi:cob(I)alamin adenosyltransferase
MKIYTKGGDKGETGLFGGDRVSKAHPRLQAYGAVDELNAAFGWLRAAGLETSIDQLLQEIQNRLFDLGAALASPDQELLEGRSHPVLEKDVCILEEAIDQWEKNLSSLQTFVLPGGSEAAARAHIVRTVVRRCERDVVAMRQSVEVSEIIIKYLNRLSDFAFVLARHLNKSAGVSDVAWEKKREE